MLKILFLFCVVFSYESYAGFCGKVFAKLKLANSTVENTNNVKPDLFLIENILKRHLTDQQVDLLTSSDESLVYAQEQLTFKPFLETVNIIKLLKTGFSVTELEALLTNLNPKYGKNKVESLYGFMRLVHIMQSRLGQKKPMSTQQMDLVEQVRTILSSIYHKEFNPPPYEELITKLQKLEGLSGSLRVFHELVKGKSRYDLALGDFGYNDRLWMSYIKRRNKAEKKMEKTLTHPQSSVIYLTQKELHENKTLFSVKEFIDRTGLSSEDLRILVDNDLLTEEAFKKTMLRVHIEDFENSNSTPPTTDTTEKMASTTRQ